MDVPRYPLHAFYCEKCCRLVYRCMHCLDGVSLGVPETVRGN